MRPGARSFGDDMMMSWRGIPTVGKISDMTAQRKALKAAGYDPIPITGKRPPMREWQKLAGADDKAIEKWTMAHPAAKSTGILAARMPTLDIDILDDKAASAVARLVTERFGNRGAILTRFGNVPKRAIPFRTKTPFSKINIPLLAPDGSPGQKLELLCSGQQLVAFGIHADTGKPYRWIGGEPGPVKRNDLPEITKVEAAKLAKDCTTLLVRDFGYKKVQERPEKTTTAKDSARAAADWRILTQNILAGTDLHDSLRDMAMKLTVAGMQAGAAVNYLTGLMDACDAPHDLRWLARRNDIKRLVADAGGKAQETETHDDADDQNHSGLEFFAAAIAEQKSKNWLIKNVAALMETSSWIGPPKSGKSALLVDLCLAIARGVDWRGFTIKRKSGVVYLALERGDLVKRRLRGHAKRDKIENIPFAIRRGIVNLMAEDCVDAIVALISEAAKEFGCDVGMLVVDTFSKAIAAGGGDENRAQDQNIVA